MPSRWAVLAFASAVHQQCHPSPADLYYYSLFKDHHPNHFDHHPNHFEHHPNHFDKRPISKIPEQLPTNWFPEQSHLSSRKRNSKFLESLMFDPSTKLQKLRELLDRFNLDAYIVPTSDQHASEYPVAADARREYITEFTGSAGTAVIEKSAANLWTDGRYFLQAERELDGSLWTLKKAGTPNCPTLSEYLKASSSLSRVGFDPFLHTNKWVEEVMKKLSGTKVQLIPVHAGSVSKHPKADDLSVMEGIHQGQFNLVDEVWDQDGSRPAYPTGPIVQMLDQVAGESVPSKLTRLRAKMTEKNSALMILASLDDIAWTFNLRGNDPAFSRLFLSYALLTQTSVTVYIKNHEEPERLSAQVLAHLNTSQVSVKPYKDISSDLLETARALQVEEQSGVWIDSAVNVALTVLTQSAVEDKKDLIEQDVPIKMMKGVKNAVEIAGMIESHLQDAAAVVLYLAWLDSLKSEDLAQLTEITAADKLEKFRKAQPDFVSLSFESISAVDANGAVIHYRPLPETAARMNPDGMYLIDSGGHYTGGTTDITRTVHFGVPSDWEMELYTRVLMGHVNLAAFIWPQKIYGCQLDVLARQPLWDIGMDYLHGTGHGVGHSLEVHEAPPSIGARCPPSGTYDQPLESGMVVSDEPGAYIDGQFGIRIENLLYTKPVFTPHQFNGATYLGFEHLTRVPYCRKLIKLELLSEKQVKYLDAYHAHTLRLLKPYLTDAKLRKEFVTQNDIHLALDWLEDACSPL